MNKKRPILCILQGQLVDWIYSPRTWIAMLVILAITYMNALSFRVWIAANSLSVHMGETIYYFFASGFGNIVMTGAMFLVMMAEVPRLAAWQNAMLFRSNRVQWLHAQILFCVLVTLLMIAFLFLCTFLLSLPILTPGTGWRDIERIAASTKESNLVLLTGKYIHAMKPLEAWFLAFNVLFAFWFTMTLVILFCALQGKPSLGVILYASLLSLHITVFWEMLPKWMQFMPANFATLMSIAGRFPEHEVEALKYSIAGYVVLDIGLIMTMGRRVKKMDIFFTERTKN